MLTKQKLRLAGPHRVERKKSYTHLYFRLTLWKDADPDVPILKEAKAECAKLQ